MKWTGFKKDPLSHISIKYKLPLGFVLLFLIIFSLAGYVIINTIYRSLEAEIMARLNNEASTRAFILDKKLNHLKRRAGDFASDGFIRTEMARLLQSPKKGHSRDRPAERLNRLRLHLNENKLAIIDAFIDLWLFDMEEQPLLRARGHVVIDSINNLSFSNQLSGFTSLKNRESPAFFIKTPLWNIARTRKLGHLYCLVDLAVVLNALKDWETERPIAEQGQHLAMTDGKGRRIAIKGWEGDRAVPARSGLTSLVLNRQAHSPAENLNDHNGRHRCRQGQERYGQTSSLKSSGWYVMYEMEAKQALAPLKILESRLLAIAILIALATLVLLYFPVQFVVRPLDTLQSLALKIRDGDFSSRATIKADDEIGHLAHAFNLMAEAVQRRTERLKQMTENVRKREQELRLEHDRLNLVVNSMKDGLILMDNHGRIILANKSAGPVLQLLKQDDIQPEVSKCHGHNNGPKHCIHCIRDIRQETACVLHIDQQVYEIISSRPIDAFGQSVKILLVRDITERERLYKQQLHQNRLAVLGKTAAVVAHEVNSPLAAISMYNQMMASEMDEASPFREHLEVIDRNTRTCRRIIRDLLDYARLPEPRYKQIRIKSILINVVRFLRPIYEKKHIYIEQKFDACKDWIMGDATQIQQVFVNLVINAIQALPERGGRITLSLTEEAPGDALVIEVTDNGSGIDVAQKETIFEPFYTTKSSSGTGLGLSTALHIVETHGGALTLKKSQPGCTVFSVRLPASDRSASKLSYQKDGVPYA